MNRDSNHFKVVLGCALVSGAGIGLFGNCIGVFTNAVCLDLGYSRGNFLLYNTVSTGICAMMLPIYAKILKKVKCRYVMMVCTVGCCVAPLIYACANELWQFYVGGIVNGIFINGITMMSTSVLLAKWFDEKLSFAVGTAYSGVGIMGAVFILILRWSIGAWGWRVSYVLVSFMGAALIFPSAIFLISEPINISAQHTEEKNVHDFLKTKSFICCISALALANLINLALYNNAISFLESLDFSPFYAALTASAGMIAMIVSKPLMGRIFDKYGIKKGGLSLSLSLFITAASAILIFENHFFAIPFALGLSFCAASNAIPASSCAQKLFKGKDYATALSFMTMASYFGSAIGTPLGAVSYDVLKTYLWGWVGCAVLSPMVGVLLAVGAKDSH